MGAESVLWGNSEMPDPTIRFHGLIQYVFMGEYGFMGAEGVS